MLTARDEMRINSDFIARPNVCKEYITLRRDVLALCRRVS
jgi:hypothetical protein